MDIGEPNLPPQPVYAAPVEEVSAWEIGKNQGSQPIDAVKFPGSLNDQSRTQLSVESFMRGSTKYDEQAEALMEHEERQSEEANAL